MKRKQLLWLGGGVVALAALFIWALAPQPVPVETAAVKRAAFELSVDEDGKTRVTDRYVVSAPLAGKLARIGLEPGDGVKAGAIVARLTPAAPAMLDARTARELEERVGAAQAALAQAQAGAARAEAAQTQAAADLERQKKLRGDGFVADAAVEQAMLAERVQAQGLAAARFAVDGAQHDLAQARAALMRAREGARVERPGTDWAIESPVAGRVLRVLQKSEVVVALGTPLLEVADPSRLEVVVDVLSTEATRVVPGAPVRIDAGGAIQLDGRVRYVEPSAFTKVSALGIEEQRVNVVIDIVSPPEKWARLGDGYRVDARIVVLAKADATVVPVAALFRDGADWAVFVVSDGAAARRKVKLGARNGTEAWLEDGVSPGDRVIVYPSDSVADGKRVKVIRAG